MVFDALKQRLIDDFLPAPNVVYSCYNGALGHELVDWLGLIFGREKHRKTIKSSPKSDELQCKNNLLVIDPEAYPETLYFSTGLPLGVQAPAVLK